MAQYTFSGVRGYQFRITLTENVGTPAQNYSTISWTIEHYQGSYEYDTVGNRIRYLTIAGTNVYYQNAPYDSTPYNFNSWWTVASGTSGTIAHNNDGTGSFQWVFYWDGYASVYGPNNTLGQGVTSGTQTFTMTTINRYAAINTFTVTPVTDVGFTINVVTDVTCDLLEYSLDNGSTWTTGFSGDYTTKSITLTDRPSNTSYQVKVRVRRKDSQLKTTSASAVSVTTVNQNNFMGFFLNA